jgi:hypothetical protein
MQAVRLRQKREKCGEKKDAPFERWEDTYIQIL